MKYKPLFIDLGFRLAAVDTAIVLYDCEQLRSKHIADIDKAIEPLINGNWQTDWSVFYTVLMLEYKKSEISNQIFVVEERKNLIKVLMTISSSPEISGKFKNGYLFQIFNKSWDLTYDRLLAESQKQCFKF